MAEKKKQKIYVFDTTLRDGAQSADISFSVRDKLRIVERFDDIGIDYIEVGFPASNPKDEELFSELKKRKYRNSKIVAFGRTKYKDTSAGNDANLRVLLDSGADTMCIFGKSSTLHVEKVLETTLENNLEMIFDSVQYLKANSPEVIYDAEHFFDGYKLDRDYAVKTLKAAEDAKADFIVLCDTNGGCLPGEILEILKDIVMQVDIPLGLHCHNDTGCAVANTVIAIEHFSQVNMVQGTINGYGERCGNADLCQIIPSLEIKLNRMCLPDGNLRHLTNLSRYISETANQVPFGAQPFVGKNAFAHKAGMHVHGVTKAPEAFEHIKPELVGNTREILVSELSGKKSIIVKAKEFGVDLEKDSDSVNRILNMVQNLEHKGYQFEAADGSFELIVKDVAGVKKKFFTLESFRVLNEKRTDAIMVSEATVKILVDDNRIIETAEGDGPVHALDSALRKALTNFYPDLEKIKLSDFKVRVLDEKQGTGAVVRVLIESTDGTRSWGTIGVSKNIIEASWQALEDSIVYGLMHLETA
ncbi:MAG: 2-isopropylmalate synthase [Actinobacteria bacterium ADurb.Bin346]|nr:MAG: 2-isopropylmalate synthase [Actinobacteria bacterium ADurb.Bin346]